MKISRTKGAQAGAKAKSGARHLRRKIEKLRKAHPSEVNRVMKQKGIKDE